VARLGRAYPGPQLKPFREVNLAPYSATFDSASFGGSPAGNQNYINWTHNVQGNFLVVTILASSIFGTNIPTVGGQQMTAIYNNNGGAFAVMMNPPKGPQPIVSGQYGSYPMFGFAASYFNVYNWSNPTTAGNSFGGYPFSVTFPTQPNDTIVSMWWTSLDPSNIYNSNGILRGTLPGSNGIGKQIMENRATSNETVISASTYGITVNGLVIRSYPFRYSQPPQPQSMSQSVVNLGVL